MAIEEFPWQVSILDANGHFCGGVIIDKRRILTAAHCIQRNNNPDYEEFIRVRAGSTNRLRGGVLRGVAKAITHKNFGDPVEFNNDIAILFLKHPLVYSASIQPIALPAANEQILANSTVFVSGWGFRRLQDEVFLPTVLNAVAVPIVEHTDCENAYGDDLTANMICAGIWKVGGKDSCQVCDFCDESTNFSAFYLILTFESLNNFGFGHFRAILADHLSSAL